MAVLPNPLITHRTLIMYNQMFSTFEHALNSLDQQFKLVTVNAKGMTFQSGLWNELQKAITQIKEIESCRNNVGPTRYLNAGPMSKMTSGQRHLSTSGQKNCQRWPNKLQLSGIVFFLYINTSSTDIVSISGKRTVLYLIHEVRTFILFNRLTNRIKYVFQLFIANRVKTLYVFLRGKATVEEKL